MSNFFKKFRAFVIVIVFLFAFVGMQNASAYTFSRTLKYGSVGNDVTELQKMLKEAGYFTATPTRNFGAQTLAALKKYQAAMGLKVDGIAGSKTITSIKAILESTSTPSTLDPSNKYDPKTGELNPEYAGNKYNTETGQPNPYYSGNPSLGNGTPNPYYNTVTVQPTYPTPAYTTPSYGGGGGGAAATDSPPNVSVTAPTNASTVSGSAVTLSAAASDDISLLGVTFKIDGSSVGVEDTSSPFTMVWDSTSVASGSHTITAVARDSAGSQTTSIGVTVTVDNTGPVISAISSGTPTPTGATITWTTNENSNSQVNYGLTTSYGSTTTLDSNMVTSHSVPITGLAEQTTYHYRVRSVDAQGNLTVSADQTFTTTLSQRAESTAFFARLSIEPTTQRKAAYDALIGSLIDGGVWNKLDGLYVLAANDRDTALTNLIQTSYGATSDPSTTFTQDRGITALGADAFFAAVDSNFNPTSAVSPHYTQNSASVFAWNTHYLRSNNNMMTDTGYTNLVMYPLQNNAQGLYMLNATAENGYSLVTDPAGLQALSRSASGTFDLYQRGIHRNTFTRASTAVPNSSIRFGGWNYPGKMAAAGFGGSLTAGEHTILNTALKTYMDTVGAPTKTAAETFSPPSLVRRGAMASGAIETTLLRYNGNLITISFGHSGSSFTVRSYPDGAVLATKTWTDGGIYGTAINIGGTIHLFGTQQPDNLTITHSTLDSSFNPTPIEVVYTVGDATRIANLSVVHNGSHYVMSVERIASPVTTFFLQSSDLTTWTSFGAPYTVPGDSYQGAPKLYYIAGTYYLSHLVRPYAGYYTKLAKSTDATTWTTSTTDDTAVLLYPEFADGHNASDVVLVQDGSNVEGVWLDGDQSTVANIRTLQYTNITLQALFESFFP